MVVFYLVTAVPSVSHSRVKLTVVLLIRVRESTVLLSWQCLLRLLFILG